MLKEIAANTILRRPNDEEAMRAAIRAHKGDMAPAAVTTIADIADPGDCTTASALAAGIRHELNGLFRCHGAGWRAHGWFTSLQILPDAPGTDGLLEDLPAAVFARRPMEKPGLLRMGLLIRGEDISSRGSAFVSAIHRDSEAAERIAAFGRSMAAVRWFSIKRFHAGIQFTSICFMSDREGRRVMKIGPAMRVPGAEPVLPVYDAGQGLFAAAPGRFHFEPVRTGLVTAILGRLGAAGAGIAAAELIVAPHGWGKTVTASQICHEWTDRLDHAGLWLGLNRRNTDPLAVLHHLIGRLHDIISTARGTARSTGPYHGGLAGLLQQLPRPFLICIDNVDYGADARGANPCPGVIDELLAAAPPGVHLLITANRPLACDLTPARRAGRLHEYGMAELAMTREEARQILQDGSAVLDPLIARTEGWAAGLRLGRLLLDRAPDSLTVAERFSGDAPDLRSWFDQHVLAAVPTETQEFLRYASLFSSFSAAQMIEVAGITDAPRHLSMLLNAGMFIMPVSSQDQTYRFHRLFLDRLRAEAEQQIPPDRQRECHRRMALWSLRQKAWQAAVDSAIATGDRAFAALVLDQAAPGLVRDQGRLYDYIRLADRLLALNVSLGAGARYWYAFALSFHLHDAPADIRRRRLAAAGGDPAQTGASRVHSRLPVISALLAGEAREAGRMARDVLAAPGLHDPFDDGWMRSVIAACQLMAGHYAGARDALRQAAPVIRAAASPFLAAWCDLIVATSFLREGNLREARRRIDETLVAAGRSMGPEAGICDMICAVGAGCAFGQGDHEMARAWVRRGLRSIGRDGSGGMSRHVVDVAVACWNGDEKDPSFQQLEALIGTCAPGLAPRLRCLAIRRLVQLGQIQDAEMAVRETGLDLRRASFCGADDGLPPDLLCLTSIEYLHARGDHAASLRLADQAQRRARQQGRMLRSVRLELIMMSIRFQTGRHADARRHLLSALRQGERCDAPQPFHDHLAVINAIAAQSDRRLDHCLVRREERAFVSRVLGPSGAGAPPAPPRSGADDPAVSSPAVSPPPAPGLNEREHELMQLVSCGMSNAMIARMLDLSENTVKWHLKNVFRKLDVINRTAAVRQFTQDALPLKQARPLSAAAI